jgi:hypothetical protein
MRFFLITLFWFGLVQAQKMPLLADNSIKSSAEILKRIQEEAMVVLRTKYSDMESNFTPHIYDIGRDFDCRSSGKSVADNETLAGLRFNNDQKMLASGLTQTISSVSHHDCFKKLIFVERIKVVAKLGVPLNEEMSSKFIRNFEVLNDEMVRQYEIENSTAEIIFSVNSQRTALGSGSRIYTTVSFLGQKWLTLDQLDPSPNERRLYIQIYPIKINSSGASVNISFGQKESSVLQFVWTDKTIERWDDNLLVNQNNFERQIAGLPIQVSTSLLKSFFNKFISRLPETNKVQTGVSDSIFFRQLQVNLNYLSTGDTSKVKLFLEQTISDIKTGKLKVEE